MTVAESLDVSSAVRRSCWIPSPGVDETGPEPPTDYLPGVDDTEQRCWQAFLESSALLLETLDRRLVDAHQLRLFDFLALDLLAKARGGSARMGDLAQALVLAPSRVTQQIHRLELEGLVRRSRSTKDRRGVIASITAEGRARVKPAARTYAQVVRENYLDQMSRRQMVAMGDSCRRITLPLRASEDRERYESP